jgi:agmatinase
MHMEAEPNFAAITSGVVSMLGAPHVPVARLAGSGARAAFLGVPFEGGNAAVERPGSANGPRGLRIASNMCFPWSFQWNVDLLDAYGLVDCGDAPLAVGNLERTHELVQAELARILGAGAIPVAIGGDHSLCIPGARALSEHLGPDRRMGYLQLDAHLDAGVDIGGERHTNCSGLVRASELPNLDPRNMAVIGVRGTINVPAWWDAVRERGIPVYPMHELRRGDVERAVAEALDRVWDGVDAVYVTFDTDSIDSSAAPGTTGPEPGGFTSHEIIRIGQMIGDRGLTAVDNVELCPVYDPSGITARLVWEVLSQMLYAHAHAVSSASAQHTGLRVTSTT